MSDNSANDTPLGWYVRVFTTQKLHGEPVTLLYLAGFSDPREAETAVKNKRASFGEKYEAVETAEHGRGPQPEPLEVRKLTGAI